MKVKVGKLILIGETSNVKVVMLQDLIMPERDAVEQRAVAAAAAAGSST